jgi:hypothetical protein
VRAQWPACRARPCTVCACLELNACKLTANAAALQLGLGPTLAEFGEQCQWDGAQPEGRRCTAKPAVVDVLALASSSCRARSYQYPAPEGLGPPNSAADCEAVAPWCEYEMGDDGDRCTGHRTDGFEAAMTAAAAAAPTEVLPPPDPPPAPTPGTSAADLTAISLAAGLAGLAVALG